MDHNDWNERYNRNELIWSAQPNQFLVDEVSSLSPGRALDIACGEGRNAVWLAERGWNVTAVDFSDVAIHKGHKLAEHRNVADRVAFDVADLRTYEPEADAFDLVAILYLQVPQPELRPILARAAAAVTPGGTLVLIGHDSANLQNGYGGPRDPSVLYTADQVVAALGDPLEVEKALTVERRVTTPDGEKIALDCLVRARHR